MRALRSLSGAELKDWWASLLLLFLNELGSILKKGMFVWDREACGLVRGLGRCS
jgi:hypothetical protein